MRRQRDSPTNSQSRSLLSFLRVKTEKTTPRAGRWAERVWVAPFGLRLAELDGNTDKSEGFGFGRNEKWGVVVCGRISSIFLIDDRKENEMRYSLQLVFQGSNDGYSGGRGGLGKSSL